MRAMPFREMPNWVVLGLTVWAAFVLGRKREARPFPALMFITGIFLSFRSARDVWFVVISAIAIIASSRPPPSIGDRLKINKAQILVATSVVGLMVVLLVRKHKLTEDGLADAMAKIFPTAAVEIVKTRGYSGPIYNHYNWGGYLIWNLPHLLVSMDGRANFHGDERAERSFKTWNGEHDWADDPELAQARLVIADVNMPLASLLRFDKRFELVYEDSLAAVFIGKSDSSK